MKPSLDPPALRATTRSSRCSLTLQRPMPLQQHTKKKGLAAALPAA